MKKSELQQLHEQWNHGTARAVEEQRRAQELAAQDLAFAAGLKFSSTLKAGQYRSYGTAPYGTAALFTPQE